MNSKNKILIEPLTNLHYTIDKISMINEYNDIAVHVTLDPDKVKENDKTCYYMFYVTIVVASEFPEKLVYNKNDIIEYITHSKNTINKIAFTQIKTIDILDNDESFLETEKLISSFLYEFFYISNGYKPLFIGKDYDKSYQLIYE